MIQWQAPEHPNDGGFYPTVNCFSAEIDHCIAVVAAYGKICAVKLCDIVILGARVADYFD